jgi:hypothetical protein
MIQDYFHKTSWQTGRVNNIKSYFATILIILLYLAMRLLPHAPNGIPFIALSLFLLVIAGWLRTTCLILFTMIIVDIALSFLLGCPAFGAWSFFTYSSMIAILVLSQFNSRQHLTLFLPLNTGLGIGFYWAWTNFGVWLTGSLYPHTFSGLISCYTAAIPFLENSAKSNLLGTLIILGVCWASRKHNVKSCRFAS